MGSVVHGDDFTFEGLADALAGIPDELRTFWLMKVRGLLGPDSTDDKEVSILNRVVRWEMEISYMKRTRVKWRSCSETWAWTAVSRLLLLESSRYVLHRSPERRRTRWWWNPAPRLIRHCFVGGQLVVSI